MSSSETGRSGEQIARTFLEARGLVFRAANVRSPFGEIDLVMEDRNATELVFVEVKTRGGTWFGSPEESITTKKLAKLRSLVAWYRQRVHWTGQVRPDVVGIVQRPGAESDITHTKYAG